MRQQARRAATRNSILDAAETLFASRGVEETTIDDIVAQAEVARGSFYYNFDSKEQVVLAISRRDFGQAATKIERKLARGDSPTQLLRELLLTACRWYGRNRHLAKTLLMTSLEQPVPPPVAEGPQTPSFRNLAERILQRGQSVGEIRGDIEAKVLAEIATGTFLQAALFWVYAPKSVRLEWWVKRCLTVFLEGAQNHEAEP